MIAVLGTALAAALGACADAPAGPGGVAAGVPDSLAVQVPVAGRGWIDAAAHDSLGVAPPGDVAFRSADTTVATIDARGSILGRRAGRTSVVAATADGRTATFAVLVRPVRFQTIYATAPLCGLTTEGEALCWFGKDQAGGNLGELGAETYVACGTQPHTGYYCAGVGSPDPVFVRTRSRFTKLAVDFSSSVCGLTTTGGVECWGPWRPGSQPVCGLVPRGHCDIAPFVVGPGPYVDVAVGRYSQWGCALTPQGAVDCWGTYNRYGQLGTGTTDIPAVQPSRVVGTTRFRSISARNANICGVAVDGTAWCWGAGFGPATAPTTPSLPVGDTPVPLRAAGGMTFDTVATGGTYYWACGLRGGTAYCWEGLGAAVPAAPGRSFSALAADELGACGLTADGQAYCWRYGAPPAALPGTMRFRRILSGGESFSAITTDGRAYRLGFSLAGPIAVLEPLDPGT